MAQAPVCMARAAKRQVGLGLAKPGGSQAVPPASMPMGRSVRSACSGWPLISGSFMARHLPCIYTSIQYAAAAPHARLDDPPAHQVGGEEQGLRHEPGAEQQRF